MNQISPEFDFPVSSLLRDDRQDAAPVHKPPLNAHRKNLIHHEIVPGEFNGVGYSFNPIMNKFFAFVVGWDLTPKLDQVRCEQERSLFIDSRACLVYPAANNAASSPAINGFTPGVSVSAGAHRAGANPELTKDFITQLGWVLWQDHGRVLTISSTKNFKRSLA